MEKTMKKIYKWKSPEGKITSVLVITDLIGKEKEKIRITGYNPFPFFSNTYFHTSRKVFEDWMLKNGYTKLTKETDCFLRLIS